RRRDDRDALCDVDRRGRARRCRTALRDPARTRRAQPTHAVKSEALPFPPKDPMPVYNFSAGPAVLPKEVLQRAAAEMLDWHGTGMSVMEMSHRGPEFISIAKKAEADLRRLLAIPQDYAVLFLQGGAIAENAIVPMNLLGDRKVIDFVDTGAWSQRTMKEAKKYAQVNVAASSADRNY